VDQSWERKSATPWLLHRLVQGWPPPNLGGESQARVFQHPLGRVRALKRLLEKPRPSFQKRTRQAQVKARGEPQVRLRALQ